MRLSEIESFLNKNQLPSEINFDACQKCTDVQKLVSSHIKILKNVNENNLTHAAKRTYKPYYDRLMKLVGHIKKKSV